MALNLNVVFWELSNYVLLLLVLLQMLMVDKEGKGRVLIPNAVKKFKNL